jgi:hypothetical protein
MEHIQAAIIRVYRRNSDTYAAEAYDGNGAKIERDFIGKNLSQLAGSFISAKVHIGDGMSLRTIEGPRFMNVSREYHDPVSGRELFDFNYWYTERMKSAEPKIEHPVRISTAP